METVAVPILCSIRWRDVLDPLPSNHPPNMSQADIVRAYVEAKENAKRDDAHDDDHAIAVPLDVSANQPTSSASGHLSSPPCRGTRQSVDGGDAADQYILWWWQRIEQFRQDLRPDRPLVANIKEEVIDDQQSNLVVQFRVAMRPVQAGLPNTLFISACYRKESA